MWSVAGRDHVEAIAVRVVDGEHRRHAVPDEQLAGGGTTLDEPLMLRGGGP